MSETTGSSTASDLPIKLLVSGVIAGVVGFVASWRGLGIALLVVAVVASIIAFWALDWMLAARSAGALPAAAPVETRPSAQLPSTSATPIPPRRGVEAPVVGEPVAVPAVEEQHNARLDDALFDPQSVEIKVSSQGTSRIFSIRIAKHGNSIGECEDAVAVDPRRAVLCVADGASSSFGAHLWADTLTKQFVQAPPKPLSVASFNSWLNGARQASPAPETAGGDDSENPNGWWSEEGARQGAYSTVVGAAIMTDGDSRVATVMCLGDSAAFVLTGATGERAVRRSLPYEDASQFGSHPALLGSMPDRAHDEPSWTTVPTAPGDVIVLASDAVAEWLLGDPKRFSLFDGNEADAIATRLIAERSAGRMVNDDLTVALLELSA